MSAIEVLHRWASDARSIREAPDAWKASLKALTLLGASAPRPLMETVFDRFLDEAPAPFYRALPSLDGAHWPVLLEALGRCQDLEARVLSAAARRGQGALETATEFVALICAASDPLSCAEKVMRSELSRAAPVLASCTEALGVGWPPPGVALAGALTAVIGLGTQAQLATVLAQRVPDELLALARTIAPALPTGRCTALLRSLDGREPPLTLSPSPSAPRFKRAAPPSAPRRKSGPLGVVSSADLLARVYAAPHDDAARAVYADSLLERQLPLGEFIQLQLARHAGRKGTLTKERLIFEEFGTRLWPDHPCAVAKVNLAFHEVERGFPAVFPTSPVPSSETRAALAALPGWRTLRVIHAWQDDVDLSTLLPAQLPLLEVLEEVGLATLERIATATWPVRRMTLTGTAMRARVTGLPNLEEVELSARSGPIFSKMLFRAAPSPAEVLAILEPSGLLSRLRRLVLRVNHLELAALVEACACLPSTLSQVEARSSPYPRLLVHRGGQGLELTVHCDGSDAEGLKQELKKLPAARIAKVDFVLESNPLLPPERRSKVERELRDLLMRFASSSVSSRPSP